METIVQRNKPANEQRVSKIVYFSLYLPQKKNCKRM